MRAVPFLRSSARSPHSSSVTHPFLRLRVDLGRRARARASRQVAWRKKVRRRRRAMFFPKPFLSRSQSSLTARPPLPPPRLSTLRPPHRSLSSVMKVERERERERWYDWCGWCHMIVDHCRFRGVILSLVQSLNTELSKNNPAKFCEKLEDFSVTGRMAVHWRAALPGGIEWRQVQICRNLFAQLCALILIYNL